MKIDGRFPPFTAGHHGGPGEPIIVLPDINVIDGSLSVTKDDACVNPGDDGRPGRSAATALRVGVIPVLPGSRWDTASAGVRRFHKSSGGSSRFIGPRPRVCQTVQANLAERRWRNTNQQSSKGSGIRQILLGCAPQTCIIPSIWVKCFPRLPNESV